MVLAMQSLAACHARSDPIVARRDRTPLSYFDSSRPATTQRQSSRRLPRAARRLTPHERWMAKDLPRAVPEREVSPSPAASRKLFHSASLRRTVRVQKESAGLGVKAGKRFEIHRLRHWNCLDVGQLKPLAEVAALRPVKLQDGESHLSQHLLNIGLGDQRIHLPSAQAPAVAPSQDRRFPDPHDEHSVHKTRVL